MATLYTSLIIFCESTTAVLVKNVYVWFSYNIGIKSYNVCNKAEVPARLYSIFGDFNTFIIRFRATIIRHTY